MFNEIVTIRQHLLNYPDGLTQTEISKQLKINRVSLSKYLATMVASGELECRSIGKAKLYTLTKRLPLKSILSQTEDHVIITDGTGKVTQIDERTAALFALQPELMIGKILGEGGTCQFFATDGSPLSARQMAETGSREFMLYNGDHITHFNQKTLPVVLTDGSRGNASILTDITERKRTEKELRDSDERYRAIYDQSPIAIELYDATGALVHVNPACLNLFGIKDITAIQNFSLFADPNISDEQKEKLQQRETVQYEGSFDFEKVKTLNLYSTLREGIIWLDVLITPLGNRADSITGFLVQIKDITERKVTEKALLESEERFHSMFKRHDSIMLLIDPVTGKIIDANRAAERFYGISHEGLCSQSIYQMNTLSKDEVTEEIWKAVREKKTSFIFPHRLANGETRTVEVRSSPIYIGKKAVLFSVITDVSERKLAEEALRESEERLNLVLRGSNDAPWDWNLESNTLYYSPRWWGMLGYVGDEFPSDAGLWERFMHPDDMDRVRHFLEDALMHGPDVYETEFRLKHKAGHYVPVLSRGFILRNTSGKAVRISGTNTDLTERKRAEERLRQSEILHRSMIESPHSIIIFSIDRDFRYLGFTVRHKEIMKAIWGVDIRHGMDMLKVIGYESDRKKAQQNFDRALSGEHFMLTEEYGDEMLGRKTWENTYSPIYDENQQVIGLTVYVTERKLAEKTLRESEENYRLIMENSSDGIIFFNGDNRVQYVSPAYINQLGYSEAEELNQTSESIYSIIHADDRDDVFSSIYEAIAQKNSKLTYSYRDITERKKADEQILLAKEEWERTFNAVPDLICILDTEHTILRVNRAMATKLGVTPEQAVGLTCYQCVHGTQNPPDFCPHSRLLKDPQEHTAEIHEDRLGGHFLVTCTPLRDNDGKLIGSVHVARDITERKKAEVALTHSHDLMRYIIEHSNSSIAVHDRDLKYIFVSQHYLDECKIKEQNIIGKHHYEVFPDLPQKWKDVHQKALAGEISSAEDDPYVQEDGTVNWTRWECRPWYEADGSIGGIIIYTEWITKRKQAEEAQRENEEKFRGIFDSINDGIHLHEITPDGKPGKFIEVNEIACRMLQYTRTELLECGPLNIVTGYHSRPFYEIIGELSSTGMSFFETEHRRKDGTIVPVEINAHVVNILGKEIVVSVIRDITERKLAHDTLQRVNRKLNVLSQLTRQDLTTQIFVLNSYLEMAKTHATGHDGIIKNIESSERAIKSIKEITEFTKDYQNMGEKPPKYQNVKLSFLFGLSHISIGEIQHRLETENLEIFADPLLEKAFQGMLENSVEHGGHVSRIRVSHTVTPDGVTIVFEDDGVGILNEKKDLIFLRGEGVRASVRGLFFVREILDITGITITETGEPGKGARFEMTVPKGAWRIAGKSA